MKIAVCVCTFRRPDGLHNLLDHLETIAWDHELEIFVADNDRGGQEGATVITQRAPAYRWPLVSSIVEQQGISFTRNQVVAMALESSPDLVAFLDDDEWPSKDWLKELVRVQQSTDADAVGGPTLPVFPDGTDESYKTNPYYGADLRQPDGSRCVLHAAGNFLIKTSVLEKMSPEIFNPEFALTGGEDLAFFLIMQKQGYRMFWAAKATVYESVPPDRMSPDWIKQRVISVANSRVYVMRKYEPDLLSSLVRGIKTSGLLVVSLLMSVLGLIHKPIALQARRMRWKFWGKFTAHMNNKRIRDEGR